MIRASHNIFICLVAGFFFHFDAKAQMVITDTTEKIAIGKYLSIFSGNPAAGIGDVIKSNRFRKIGRTVPNLGISNLNNWLKFTASNHSQTSHFILEIAYPILDEVELYIPEGENRYKSVFMGENRPFKTRKYFLPNYLFDIYIPPSSTRTFFLRVRSTEQVILPIYLGTTAILLEKVNMDHVINGIFIGVVMIMVLYNLFLFFSVRDTSYIYYVLYVGFAGLTQMSIRGYNFQYLWPNSPEFEQKSAILFGCLSGIAALMFANNFLQLRTNVPIFKLFLNSFIALFAIGFLLTIFGLSQYGFIIMQFTTGIGSLTVLIISFRVMAKGYSPAKFFVFGWSVLLLGSIIFLLKDYGVLPYNIFTSYSVQGASAIEMALLSFGLAYSINILKQEKELSQAEALRVSKENERLIREQNEVLERKVGERTSELKESNINLEQAMTNLKEAQSQLVESEKMASLGQLTAGVAHEINNPINFVTSNVKPLRRDLSVVLEALQEIEKIGLSDLSVSEKSKQMKAYKAQLDFDYLKTEIDHLLNGMYEGATRTSEIVKSLRIFSRVDEDDLKMANINECMESTLVILNSLLNDKNVFVEKDLGDLPDIECYPGKLNQVFLNIMSNAIYAIHKQHSLDGNGKLYISTRAKQAYIEVLFRDNGIGMDERTKSKMFEPFFTTKDVGEGTGLGMSIVYNTVQKHNGKIEVTTAPGEGASFILKFPLRQKN
ncbi:hypothetical protein SAMN05216436_10859 [bacterium A37T11]|nr:hypothetical protein SAMN05216436_10859 [bacterium A37T11]